MENWTERLYPHLPIAAQNLACSLYGLRESRVRFNRDFERFLLWLEGTQHWTAASAGAYQDEQLSELIRYVYTHVPYYRDVMRARKLVPADIRKREDLPKLPILTKEDVRMNVGKLLADNVDRRQIDFVHTSGTTGKSLEFYVTRKSTAFRWALWWRHRQRFGVNLRDWHANFTGKRVIPPEQSAPPYWRWNIPSRQILLNMQHIVPDKIERIADFLGSRNLEYYSGYPSIIHAFARRMLDAGIQLRRKPKFVITGAENMLPYQHRDIAQVTSAVLTDQYGFSEGCANASHCTSFAYHEDFEYGIFEALEPITDSQSGEVRGSILATGFASPAFPFIRYEVGDIGIWAPQSSQCACGMKTPRLMRIDGRMDDYVVTPEGRQIMRFDYLFKDTQSIRETQVVQRVPHQIELMVVRRADYSSRDEEHVRREVASWISPRLDVVFHYVDEIPREANGKFRAVRSFLSNRPTTAP